MNERGFFNVVGLCLLLVVAISIAGVHETERNFSYNVANVQLAHELKNVADSALVKAAEIVRDADDKQLVAKEIHKIPSLSLQREQRKQIYADEVKRSDSQNISVEVLAEIGEIKHLHIVKYNGSRVDCKQGSSFEGVVLISVASYAEHYQSSRAYLLYDTNVANYEYPLNYINGTNLTAVLNN